VAFTRNPADGTNEFYGDFLVNAQGEDVVAGIRNTTPIAEPHDVMPEVAAELEGVFTTLENHYRDMCDIEFTIEQGKLWMLQTRVGKRTAKAALKIAVDMVDEGLISGRRRSLRIDPDQLDQLLHPQFDAEATYETLAKGLNASPARRWARSSSRPTTPWLPSRRPQGHPCALGDDPDDLHGMIAARAS
jgi:pyruvate, orthophosphate dikinase